MISIARGSVSRRQGTLAFMFVAILLLVASRSASGSYPAFPMADHPAQPGLSVMTYNVAGLPWPVRFGRAEALGRIGSRLADMRASGRQPRVVLLQEAFSEDAVAIRAAAGYRYAAFGPASDTPRTPARAAADRAFQAQSSFIKGERSGRIASSGLVILSDFPILSVHSVPFPDYACAGYDCLANKGVVMAVVRVPGEPRPVAIVNLHLNAKKASGVSRERADTAFRRQVDTLEAFLATHIRADTPAIVAGDFNIGRSTARRAIVMAALARRGGGIPLDVLGACAEACEDGLPEDAQLAQRRAKDWQFLLPGAASQLAVRRVSAPFGREADGTMLSDHIGYTAWLELHPRGGGQPSPRG